MLSTWLDFLKQLLDLLKTGLVAFFSYQQGKKSVTTEAIEKDLEDAKKAQELKNNIKSLSNDSDLDSLL